MAQIMDEPHKDAITTAPAAVKQGQRRLHIYRNEHPWHELTETLKCSKCETAFILTGGFARDKVLGILEKQHANHEEHPDIISSDPAFMTLVDCDCQTENCKTCNGRGKVSAPQAASGGIDATGDLKTCSDCGGTGKKESTLKS